MTPGEDSPFYVGYQRVAPRPLARFLRRLVVGLLAGVAALAALLPTRQRPFDPGTFEYGQVRDFLGVIRERPYPVLTLAAAPGTPASQSSYDLVAIGKRGAAREVEGLDGRWATLSGSLIHRQGRAMVEVVPRSVAAVEREGEAPAEAGREEIATLTLAGEIVDSKCFLGVMKPGRGKPHRECAALCIRGGIPPRFVVESAAGRLLALLLVDEDGGPVNARVLDKVAEPLSITGRVWRQGGELVLAADPATYRRLE